LCFGADLGDGLGWNGPTACERRAHGNLDLEHELVAALVAPERSHLGTRVSRYHSGLPVISAPTRQASGPVDRKKESSDRSISGAETRDLSELGIRESGGGECVPKTGRIVRSATRSRLKFRSGCMTEPTVSACGIVEHLHFLDLAIGNRTDDELRDALSRLDANRIGRKVDQDDRNLAAVVGIDGPRSVRNAEALAQRKPAARAHLAFVTTRNRDRESARYGKARARSDDDGRPDRSRQIHADGAVGHAARKLDGNVADAPHLHSKWFAGAGHHELRKPEAPSRRLRGRRAARRRRARSRTSRARARSCRRWSRLRSPR